MLGAKPIILVASLAVFVRASSVVTVSAPGAVPSDASNVVDHAFVGFGVEMASWPDYAGNLSSPNLFSRNLVEALTNRTGKGTIFRIGGTSADHSYYDPSQTSAVVRPASQVGLNVPFGITIGSTFFEAYANFPGNNYTVMVPLAFVKDGNFSSSIAETQAAIAGMGGLSNLESLELGNEPNVYPGSDRPADYGPANYTQEWLQYTPELISACGLADGPSQQALAIGNDALPRWNVSSFFGDGIDVNGTTKRFAHFITPITYLQDNYPSIPFVLGEVGSDLNPTPRVNDNALEAVLGSALWTVDFMLYAMSKNVYRISMQQGTNFGYAAWLPISSEGIAAHVRAPYYGLACVADFIGTQADLQVVNIDLSSPTLAAYAGYVSGTLSKYALINLDYHDPSTGTTTRPVQTFSLPIPSGIGHVQVDHLSGPNSNANDSITWVGSTWTFATQGRATKVLDDTLLLPVSDGTVSVTVNASEAVVVSLVQGPIPEASETGQAATSAASTAVVSSSRTAALTSLVVSFLLMLVYAC